MNSIRADHNSIPYFHLFIDVCATVHAMQRSAPLPATNTYKLKNGNILANAFVFIYAIQFDTVESEYDRQSTHIRKIPTHINPHMST